MKTKDLPGGKKAIQRYKQFKQKRQTWSIDIDHLLENGWEITQLVALPGHVNLQIVLREIRKSNVEKIAFCLDDYVEVTLNYVIEYLQNKDFDLPTNTHSLVPVELIPDLTEVNGFEVFEKNGLWVYASRRLILKAIIDDL